MDEFLIVENLEKHVKNIFKDDAKNIENRERFLEKIAKKSESLDGDEKTFFQLKQLVKKMLGTNINYSKNLLSKEFDELSKEFFLTRNEFEKIILKANEEKEKEYYESPAIKKIVSEIKGELPTISARVYNINLGLFQKSNGEELTLKEYSQLTGEDYETLLVILKNAQNLIAKKLQRRLSR